MGQLQPANAASRTPMRSSLMQSVRPQSDRMS
jgi:hypothetical protein